MTFKSKRTIAALVTGTALIIAYIFYAIGNRAPASGDVAAWARTILIFIGIAVLANIVIQILFHIAYSVGVAVKEHNRDNEEVERIIASETAEDELDKIISLKSSHVGYIFAGIGFLAALAGLAFWDASTVVALHVMTGAFFVGNFIEGCVSIRFYERGV